MICEPLSAGYWKTHPEVWPAPFDPVAGVTTLQLPGYRLERSLLTTQLNAAAGYDAPAVAAPLIAHALAVLEHGSDADRVAEALALASRWHVPYESPPELPGETEWSDPDLPGVPVDEQELFPPLPAVVELLPEVASPPEDLDPLPAVVELLPEVASRPEAAIELPPPLPEPPLVVDRPLEGVLPSDLRPGVPELLPEPPPPLLVGVPLPEVPDAPELARVTLRITLRGTEFLPAPPPAEPASPLVGAAVVGGSGLLAWLLLL